MEHLPGDAANGYPVEHLEGSLGPEVTDTHTRSGAQSSHVYSNMDALVAPVPTSKPRECFVVACPEVLTGLRVRSTRHGQSTRHALVGGCGAVLLPQ